MDRKKFTDLERLKVVATYGICAMAVLGFLHCVFLVFGIDLFTIHILACFFGLVLGIVLSRLFGMCAVHRCCVYYIMAVIACIVFRKYNLFGGYLLHARVVMMCVGAVLTLSLVWKMICRKP